jgi:pseudouridine synthase
MAEHPPPELAPAAPRLQKMLADLGLGSRRQIETWIAAGRVEVNGVVAILGQRVGPRDRVVIDGRAVGRKPVEGASEPRVLLYKKRVGEVVTRADPDGRRTVFRKLPELVQGRWIAVGRLDINTSGLLLLTNHGELARRLMHPSFELPRRYAVRVLGDLDAAVLQQLRRGVSLDDGPARFDLIERTSAVDDEEGSASSANNWYHVVVREGRNRLVRRLLESQGVRVSRLMRVGYGPIQLGGGIRSGSFRELDRAEVTSLFEAVDLARAEPKRTRR